MALISEKDQERIREKFHQELQDRVKVALFTQRETGLVIPGQECPYCRETRQLMEEVAALSDKLQLEIHDFVAEADKAREWGVDKIPALVLGADGSTRLKFFGMPSGYEFATLVEALISISQGKTALSEKTREELRKLDEDLHVQVFVTPT
jgi:glutaredoxin-like protein